MAVDPSDRETQRLARKARRQAEKRAAILLVATGVMERDGVEGLTMAAIARAADVTTPGLYYYFNGIDDIVDEMAVMCLEEEIAAVELATADVVDPVLLLQTLVRARVDWYAARPARWHLLYEGVSRLGVSAKTLQERVYPRVGAFNAVLEARLTAAQASGQMNPALHARRTLNVAWFTAQGILSAGLGMARAGGGLRFALDDLVEESGLILGIAAGTALPDR